MVDLTQIMDDEVFMAFASYATIILSKMMLMSATTAFYRMTRKEFNSASQILLYSILQPKVLSALEKEKRYTCSDKVQDTFPIPYSFMLLAGSLKPLAGRTIDPSSEKVPRPGGGAATVCTAPPRDETLAFQHRSIQDHIHSTQKDKKKVERQTDQLVKYRESSERQNKRLRFWQLSINEHEANMKEAAAPGRSLSLEQRGGLGPKGDSALQHVLTGRARNRMPGTESQKKAHLNDLENIVPFLGIGLLYSLSGPDLSTAILHFRLFVGARIYHTISYLTPLPQPNRGLSFFIGYGVTLSMAYRLLKNKLYL
ncbi:hypothetical protein H8959_015009 [Pygathrix nigripes]